MELSLDLSLLCVPKPLSESLSDVSGIRDRSFKLSEIDGYVDRLEEEKRKIDAFKRELPLCMFLLNDAIGRLKEEAVRCKGMDRKFDEDGGVNVESSNNDKKNWMSSVGLWTPNARRTESNDEEDDRSATENSNSNGDVGGAVMSFQRAPGHEALLPRLSLVPRVISEPSCRVGSGSVIHTDQTQMKFYQSKSQQRKQRLRWSPELHRLFVDALHQLGGSQVATPKQIRELMQVEGLTNDEVKSHLQKYRLHIRKPSASQAAAEQATTMWIDQNPYDDESNRSMSRSASPQCHLVAARGLFSNGGESVEAEEDEKSDCRSRKVRVT